MYLTSHDIFVLALIVLAIWVFDYFSLRNRVKDLENKAESVSSERIDVLETRIETLDSDMDNIGENVREIASDVSNNNEKRIRNTKLLEKECAEIRDVIEDVDTKLNNLAEAAVSAIKSLGGALELPVTDAIAEDEEVQA